MTTSESRPSSDAPMASCWSGRKEWYPQWREMMSSSTRHFTIRAVLTIQASALHARAIEAVDDLLSKLRIEHLFVGGVARAAWLGGALESGSVDVLGLMQPQQKSQVAMMGSNRGFRVEREEVEESEELDLIPMKF